MITSCARCNLKYKQNTIDNLTFANKGAEVSYLAVWNRHTSYPLVITSYDNIHIVLYTKILKLFTIIEL